LNKAASIYNFFALLVKIIGGPLVYYFIALKFNPFFLVSYFFILSINNIRTIFEGGVTNIVKRKYANQKFNKLKSINTFSFYWFNLVGLVIFIISMIIGSLYIMYALNAFNALILPLLLATFASSLRVSMLYKDAYLDGYVSSSIYRKILLISNMVSVFILIIAILLDFNLYSIFFSVISQVIVINFYFKVHMKTFKIYKYNSMKIFTLQYFKLKDLIKPTMQTWSVGYIFWNSIMFVTPIIYSEEKSAKIIFTFVIFKAIADLSSSFISANIPTITKMIKSNSLFDMKKILIKILVIGSLLYSFTTISLIILLQFDFLIKLSLKLMELNSLILVIILFYIIFLKTVIHNFIRCFEIEPFFYYVLYNAVIFTISPFISFYLGINYFLPHIILMIPMIIFTFKLLRIKLSDA